VRILAKRSYLSGLVTGGLLGAVLGAFISSRQSDERKAQEMGESARRVLRGISIGMLEMMRR